MQSAQPNRESLPLPRSTLSTRLSRIFIHKMVGRLSQGPGDAADRCLPVCELSGGRDCTMRRVLRAILLALCTLASLSIRDAIAARAAVGQCKSYANAHHCQYDRRNKIMRVPVSFFRDLSLEASRCFASGRATQRVAETQPLTQNFFLAQINRS
jgi:hypothetical protein